MSDQNETPVKRDVSAVVVSDGDTELLLRCLGSLGSVLENDPTDVHAVIVDNGSVPPIDLGIVDLNLIRLDERQPNNAAFMEGLKHAHGELALLITPDMLFDGAFLPPLLAAMDNDETLDSVSPTVIRLVGETWEPGVTASIEAENGVCLMLRVESGGEKIAHVEDSLVSSAPPL